MLGQAGSLLGQCRAFANRPVVPRSSASSDCWAAGRVPTAAGSYCLRVLKYSGGAVPAVTPGGRSLDPVSRSICKDRDPSRLRREHRPLCLVRRRFIAVPAVLGPESLDGAGDRDVPDPLEAPFLAPRRRYTAGRAPGRLVGFDTTSRRPSSSRLTDMTRWSGRLKMLVAASDATPVGSFKARGPVPG